MINFTKLTDLVNTKMDASEMHLSYNYEFNADRLTLAFHKPNDESDKLAEFVFQAASTDLAVIVQTVDEFLSKPADKLLPDTSFIDFSEMNAEQIADRLAQWQEDENGMFEDACDIIGGLEIHLRTVNFVTK